MHSSIDDETLERVARAMCQADGKDPDQRHLTGDVETVRSAGGGSSQEDVTIPMWRRYLARPDAHRGGSSDQGPNLVEPHGRVVE
jgi:hypothetical protein